MNKSVYYLDEWLPKRNVLGNPLGLEKSAKRFSPFFKMLFHNVHNTAVHVYIFLYNYNDGYRPENIFLMSQDPVWRW